MKYVLLYESANDVMSKAPLHYDAHVAWADQFEARGELLQIGTFEDPQTQGSMAVFRTREAAEAFVGPDSATLEQRCVHLMRTVPLTISCTCAQEQSALAVDTGTATRRRPRAPTASQAVTLMTGIR